MTELRTDVENIPLDGRHVIIGTMKGEVFISRHIVADSHNPHGRWPGLATTDWPIAWAEIPTHPYFPEGSKALISGEKAKP